MNNSSNLKFRNKPRKYSLITGQEFIPDAIDIEKHIKNLFLKKIFEEIIISRMPDNYKTYLLGIKKINNGKLLTFGVNAGEYVLIIDILNGNKTNDTRTGFEVKGNLINYHFVVSIGKTTSIGNFNLFSYNGLYKCTLSKEEIRGLSHFTFSFGQIDTTSNPDRDSKYKLKEFKENIDDYPKLLSFSSPSYTLREQIKLWLASLFK